MASHQSQPPTQGGNITYKDAGILRMIASTGCARLIELASACVLAIVSMVLGSCDKGSSDSQQTVVLYYSADDVYARPIIELFEDETGIRVLGRGDTEATKTTGLVQRLRAEAHSPRADVFWSSEVFLTIQLAAEGMLAAHEPADAIDRPAYLMDAEGRWHGFALRARVLVYNTQRVNHSELPANLYELTNGRWRGHLVMARPAFGTTRGHMAALVAAWGEDRARQFLRELHDNDIRIVDGNSSVVRAVANGEADIGLTDTDDVWAGQRNGWPIEMVYIRHDDPETGAAHGPMLIPNTVSLVKGGPNPDAAAQLIDFLLSARVERMLANSASRNIPTNPSLAEEFSELLVPGAMQIPYSEIADAMATSMKITAEELHR